jgi:PIN domain nuclease of toxin-antitoxin system
MGAARRRSAGPLPLILLDTHALYWLDQGDAHLGSLTEDCARGAWQAGELMVSAVTFWEMALLVARRKLSLGLSVTRWRAELLGTGIGEIALDGATAALSVDLELPHKDPADRFIVATALLSDATLLTADEKILAWSGPLARLDARL